MFINSKNLFAKFDFILFDAQSKMSSHNTNRRLEYNIPHEDDVQIISRTDIATINEIQRLTTTTDSSSDPDRSRRAQDLDALPVINPTLLNSKRQKAEISHFNTQNLQFDQASSHTVESFTCVICQEFCPHFTQCSQCEICVCKTCLNIIASSDGSHAICDHTFVQCPVCKSSAFYEDWKIRPAAHRLLALLKIKCPLKCSDEWFSLTSINLHLQLCESAYHQCSSCDLLMSEKQFQKHIYKATDKNILITCDSSKACKSRQQCPLCLDFIMKDRYNLDHCPVLNRNSLCPICLTSSVSPSSYATHILNNIHTHLPILTSNLDVHQMSFCQMLHDAQNSQMQKHMSNIIAENVSLKNFAVRHSADSDLIKENAKLKKLCSQLVAQIQNHHSTGQQESEDHSAPILRRTVPALRSKRLRS